MSEALNEIKDNIIPFPSDKIYRHDEIRDRFALDNIEPAKIIEAFSYSVSMLPRNDLEMWINKRLREFRYIGTVALYPTKITIDGSKKIQQWIFKQF